MRQLAPLLSNVIFKNTDQRQTGRDAEQARQYLIVHWSRANLRHDLNREQEKESPTCGGALLEYLTMVPVSSDSVPA